MNKALVAIVSGAIGMVVGSIGSYIFFKKKYETDYYDALEKAIDEECEAARKRHSEIQKAIKEETQVIRKVDSTTYEVALSAAKSYTALSEPGPDEVNAGEGPRLISEDEYRFLPPNYDIREFQYLRKDGTMLDVEDQIVDFPEVYISGLEKEIENAPHLSHVYILIENVKIGVDLEVIDASYESIYETE